MYISNTAKLLSIVIVVTIAVYGGVVFVFLDTKQASERANKLADRVAVQEQQRSEFQMVREMVQNNSDEMERLQTYFIAPETAGTAAFLNSLESLSLISGAEVTSRSVEVDRPEGRLLRVALQLQTSGSWGELYHTIALLETMPYDIRISEVKMSGSGSDPSSWNGTIQISAAKLQATSTIDTQ